MHTTAAAGRYSALDTAPLSSLSLQLSGVSCRDSASQRLLLSACLNRSARLHSLELDRCDLGDHGMLSLATILPLLSSLKKISLAENRLSATGFRSLLTFIAQRQWEDPHSSEKNEISSQDTAVELETLRLDGNELAEHGDCVHVGRFQMGVVTSGVRSPVLGASIALCRIAVQYSEPGTRVEVGKLDGGLGQVTRTGCMELRPNLAGCRSSRTLLQGFPSHFAFSNL